MATCAECGKKIELRDEVFVVNGKRFHLLCGIGHVLSQAKWDSCPLCFSDKEAFKVRGSTILICDNCLAEWEMKWAHGGIGKRIRLKKPSEDGKGKHHLGIWRPFDRWITTDLMKTIREEIQQESVKRANWIVSLGLTVVFLELFSLLLLGILLTTRDAGVIEFMTKILFGLGITIVLVVWVALYLTGGTIKLILKKLGGKPSSASQHRKKS